MFVLSGGPAGLSVVGSQWLSEWHLGPFNGSGEVEGYESFGRGLASGDFNGDG